MPLPFEQWANARSHAVQQVGLCAGIVYLIFTSPPFFIIICVFLCHDVRVSGLSGIMVQQVRLCGQTYAQGYIEL